MQSHTFKQHVSYRLDYLLYLPDGYTGKPTPLLLYLHGGGESGGDVGRLQAKGLPKLLEAGMTLPFIVLVPHNPDPDKFFPNTLVSALLDEVTASYRIDASRIYLTGYSRGGFGAWHLAMQRPETFAALVPVAAGGLATYAFRLQHVPVWAFHGSRDETVPLSYGAAMVEALSAAGGDAKLTVLGADHETVLEQTYRNPALYRWLLEQRRLPKNVTKGVGT